MYIQSCQTGQCYCRNQAYREAQHNCSQEVDQAHGNCWVTQDGNPQKLSSILNPDQQGYWNFLKRNEKSKESISYSLKQWINEFHIYLNCRNYREINVINQDHYSCEKKAWKLRLARIQALTSAVLVQCPN